MVAWATVVLVALYGLIAAVNRTDGSLIGLNAHLLSLNKTYRSAGASWYIHHILRHLPAADPALRYTAFLHEPLFSPPQGMLVRRTRWSTSTPYRRIVWEQLAAPAMLRREQVDLLHAMAFVAPVASPCPTVVTILDLSFLLFPSAFRAINRLYLQSMTKLSVTKAKRVIAISDNTKRDIVALMGLPADRIDTIYCGIDPVFTSLPEAIVHDFRREKGLPERFVLFLGTIEPRKNVTQLIRAFAALLSAAPQSTAGLQLIVAGGKGWFYDSVFAQVQDLGVQDRVHFAGYVPEEEKPLWYNAATCFCYPSLYEGFGLPPLEAMACGTPVITSNASSLPEVVGGAGIQVPPQDTPALSDALHQVLFHPAVHADLSAKGQIRAKQFSWDLAARKTAATYRLALENS
jgi:glycosyltransferase involved in cell wall biosynthesis